MTNQPKFVDFLAGISGDNLGSEKQNRLHRLQIRKNLSIQEQEKYCQFGYDYFDSDIGYGGYYYDGRYGRPAEKMIEYYQLKPGSRVLDVGCAKGFLVYEFQQRLSIDNQPTAFGCDISKYALEKAKEEVKLQLFLMSADQLSFPDNNFDLVVAVDVIHNLPPDLAEMAIKEIMRVSQGKYFIQIASYTNDVEFNNLRTWGLAVQTFRSTTEWVNYLQEIGYDGEYAFKIMKFTE